MAKPPVSSQSRFLVGDTLNFIANPALWSKKIMDQAPVVEISLAGKKGYFMWGAEAMKAFYDESNVIRSKKEGSINTFLFDNKRNVAPLMDGEEHRIRKAMLIAVHNPAHVGEYLNKISAMTDDFIAKLKSDLLPDGQFTDLKFFPRLHEFQVQFTTRLFFSSEADDTFQKETNTYLEGVGALPIPLPGFKYHNGLKATQYLVNYLRARMAEHRADPDKYNDIMADLMKSNPQLTDDDIVPELQHFMFAISAVPIAVCAAMMGTLQNPDVFKKIKEEINNHKEFLDPGYHYRQQTITDNFEYSLNVMKETLRYHPIVPIQTGDSIRNFEVDGFLVPAKSLIIGGFYATDLDPKVYPNPDSFLPDRFKELKDVETSWFWAPFGAGPRPQTHRCAGQPTVLAVSTYLLVRLLSTFEFELVDPKQALDHSKTVPMPVNDMPVRIRAL